ncbi:MAG: ROK family protein, partial [SAR202 cluster bacterium]|nr:ROK family protein [SAR202 cluster bacterium]
GVPLRALLEQRLGAPVALDNCENVAALAEHRFGAGQGARHMLYVAVGTRIGAGIIRGRGLYRGANGAAGEVGHMVITPGGPECACGKLGCWEALVSGTAIARDARERMSRGEPSLMLEMLRGEIRRATSEMVGEAAARGDELANDVLANAARLLGIGLANLVTVFDPEVVVVGGGVAQLGDVLLKPAFAAARRELYPFQTTRVWLAAASLGDRAGVIGGLMLARAMKKRNGIRA